MSCWSGLNEFYDRRSHLEMSLLMFSRLQNCMHTSSPMETAETTDMLPTTEGLVTATSSTQEARDTLKYILLCYKGRE